MDPTEVSIDSLMEQFSRRAEGNCGEEALLRLAFTGPLIPGEQILKPITSLDGIYKTNRSMLLPVEHFYDACDRLEIVEAEPLTLNGGTSQLLKLTYRLAEREYRAYAYVETGPKPARRAALIIPGSAPNLATGIYHEDPENNHTGIMRALDAGWD